MTQVVTDWSLVFEGTDAEREGFREALCTLGNGYVATRGAAPESSADGVHYPGTYVAGCYDRLVTQIAGREVGNEDLVNVPNWLPVTFRIGEGPWFGSEAFRTLEVRQELDLRRAVLTRSLRVQDQDGRITAVTDRRFVSMRDAHVLGIEVTLRAQNWSGPATIRSGLDGGVTNSGVARYRELRGDHLVPLQAEEIGEDTVLLEMETRGSRVHIAQAARNHILRNGNHQAVSRRTVREGPWIGHDLTVEMTEGAPVTLEKIVTLVTSRDRAVYEPAEDAPIWVARAPGFERLLAEHAVAWAHVWRRCDIRIEGPAEAQGILRLHVFHLLQTVSPNTIGLDVGVPARGLHGEAYRGHVFWDELFIFPFLNQRLSVLTRSLLMYRFRRMPEAKWAAREAGFRGAMFPWQSGTTGREESQTWHLNPRSGRWLPDHSHLQRHIGLAIAYNIWQYYQVTGDLEFVRFYGAPMLIEIARFFDSLASYDRATDRYEIRGVMGPDEYHDAYPDADQPGLNNNAYTNAMAVWLFVRVLEILELFPETQLQELWETLELTREEVDRWDELSRKMRIAFHEDGIISQFEGYGQLQEFDWEGYRRRYGDIQRLDRILESEGDTPNRYKLSKQADVLMLFYLLSADELRELFSRLGYELTPDLIDRNITYYLNRTSHGSTLSRLVHSWVLARSDRELSWDLFAEALRSDVADVQGGTTAEGIHLGAMAGTVDMVQRGYSGIEVRGDVLWLNPTLPQELSDLELHLHYRGHRVFVSISGKRLVVSTPLSEEAPIKIGLLDEVHEFVPGTTIEVAFSE
ncbi:MAG TPA: glycosyl hydrolase family 65 protein [Actinomycetota bacterium]|nr:glycosyl hydrolase family 65 protein [Actinomycetota bacterium]